MKTAVELYGEKKYGWCFYQPMIEEFGKIAVQQDDDDYQGDTRVLYADGERYGYLCFGWGSCSACDALQGCGSIAEVQSLMDELRDSVKWFDSKADALTFFETHDWRGDYSHSDQFINDCIHYLKG